MRVGDDYNIILLPFKWVKTTGGGGGKMRLGTKWRTYFRFLMKLKMQMTSIYRALTIFLSGQTAKLVMKILRELCLYVTQFRI